MQERHEAFMKRNFLEEEIRELEKQIEPSGTGHIHTTIGTLKHRYKQMTGYDYGYFPTGKNYDSEGDWDKFFAKEENKYLNTNSAFDTYQKEVFDTYQKEVDASYKFKENQYIEEIKKYIDSTYSQHYSSNTFQSTEVIIDRGHGTGFCMGNVDKYSNRYGKKGTKDDARKDLMKVIHYAILQLYVHDTQDDN